MEERLRKFASLIDAGSFTKAARELHISQPALSSAIAKLERELKVKLLVRGARPLAVTPAGKVAYQAAKDLAVQTDNLKLRLAELAHEKLSLKIGMIDSIADALFENGNGLEMIENAKVSVVVNNTRHLTDAIDRGELDIAFVAEQSKRLPASLDTKPVGIEPLVVVRSARRSLAAGNRLPDFICYDQPSNTFRLVQRALGEFGMTPEPVFYSTSPEVMLRLVLLDKGIAALPYLMIREHLVSGELTRLGGMRPWLIERPVIALKRRDKELPLPLKQLMHQTTQVLERLMAEAQFAADAN